MSGAESSRPVEALLRGLAVMRALGDGREYTCQQLRRATGLARTTVLRVLRTLAADGYVRPGVKVRTWRVAERARCLSHGYDDLALLADCGLAVLPALNAEVRWPVALSTVRGLELEILCNTDADSPLVVTRIPRGTRLALGSTAAGVVCLANLPPHWCDEIIALMQTLPPPQSKRTSRDDLDDLPTDLSTAAAERRLRAEIAAARSQGYALVRREGRVSEQIALSVPVRVDEHLVGALTSCFAAKALPLDRALSQLRPRLDAAAQSIVRRFEEASSGRAERALQPVAVPRTSTPLATCLPHVGRIDDSGPRRIATT